ncbi:MAG: hypothetical protein ACTSVU_10040 [Promethearchaeota archaeon]
MVEEENNQNKVEGQSSEEKSSEENKFEEKGSEQIKSEEENEEANHENWNEDMYIPMDTPMEELPQIVSPAEQTKNIKLYLLDIMEEINLPVDYNFLEQVEKVSPDTLNRIKILLIANKQLKQLHNKLQNQIKQIESSKTEFSGEPENLAIKLAQNLKKLEETRLKDLMNDFTTRFMEKTSESSVEQTSENKEKELKELEAWVQEIKQPTQASQISMQSDSTQTPEISQDVAREMEELKKINEDKSNKITELEEEIQNKIREIETYKNEINTINELREKNQLLHDRAQNAEHQLQEANTEYEILKNEFKIFESKNRDLENKLEQKQADLIEQEKLKQQFSEIEAQNHQLTADFENSLEEKQHFQQKITDLTTQKEELKLSLQELEDKLSEDQNQIEHIQSNLQQKTTRIEELEADLEQKNVEIQNLREELTKTGQSDANITELNRQIMEKEVIIDDLKQEIREYEDKVSVMVHREELERIQSESMALVHQLESRDLKITEIEHEFNEKIEKLNHEKEELTSKITELETQLADKAELEIQIKDKEEQIKEFQEQEEEFHEALLDSVKLTAEKEDLNTKITELINQKSVLYNRISDLSNQNRGHTAIIKRLQNQIESLKEDLENRSNEPVETPETMQEKIEKEFLSKQVSDLNRELREQIAKAAEATGRYEVIKDQYEQTKIQLKETGDDLDLLKQDFRNLEQKLIQEKEEFKAISKNNEEKITNLNEQCDKLEAKAKEAADNQEFIEEIASLKRDLKEQETIAESLADDVSKKNIELMMVKKESQRLTEEIVQLKRRIKLLRRDLSSQSSE